MPNVCEECSAVNTDGVTVCRTCGYPLFLDSAIPAASFRHGMVMAPARSRRPIAWLVGGLIAMTLLALAAVLFDVATSPPKRMVFGPNAPPSAVSPAPPVAPLAMPAPPGFTAEEGVAASPSSAAFAVAAPPLRSSSSAPLKRAAAKPSLKPPVSGNANSAVAETAASDPPTPGPDAPPPALSQAETSPSELCADKSFLALGVCLAQQCNTFGLFDHPACVRVREQDNKRREREDLGG
jgi:hypothetical protein